MPSLKTCRTPCQMPLHMHHLHLFLLCSAASEQGVGEGLGYTINCPLPPGSGTGAYKAAFERCGVLKTNTCVYVHACVLMCGCACVYLVRVGYKFVCRISI